MGSGVQGVCMDRQWQGVGLSRVGHGGAVADPGFPEGGTKVRCGDIAENQYVKRIWMLGGVRRRRPLDPPMWGLSKCAPSEMCPQTDSK